MFLMSRITFSLILLLLLTPSFLPSPVVAACAPERPSTCGQVRVSGALLADDGGRWTPRGVQFILPEFGINPKTFRDQNYAAAIADGSLDYWLNKAQLYLRANMLRIFVEMPYIDDGALFTPTSYAPLVDFAGRADARGMRIGLVLHNSSDWRMTPERLAWLNGLLDTLGSHGLIPVVAYVSADNEINNHCGSSGRDCFDSDAANNAQPYIDGAIDWTAQFRTVVKARAPQVLVTVGMSTEMRDVNQTRAAFNFFRTDSSGRTLAGLVDFLAPHNFGGGAAGIIDDLRFAGYTAPVMLEEFGFPSDPFPRNRLWSEGPPICRFAPLNSACFETASYFVEANIQALKTRSYAGASAWMLADMREKDVTNACLDPAVPFDLWTGLFSIGGTYCDGGTYSRGVGEPKATAVRVCAYYAGTVGLCDPVAYPYQVYFPIMAR